MTRARGHRWATSLRALRLAATFWLLAGVCRAEALGELDAYARGWAERANVSGSWRLQRGEQLLAEGSRGFVRGSSGELIGADTVLWIGSISKQFAAVAVLELVEQGKLALDAPLTEYLPELNPEALTKGGVTCTLEHVLSHRAGFTRDVGGPFDFAGYLANAQTQAAFLERVGERRLGFVPGSDFEYSNLGYDLIGLVVQRASGQSYESFLTKQLFGPLGMTRTGIEPRPGLTFARGLAGAGFTWVDAADWLRFDVMSPASRGPSGNIYSTPRDLLRWSHALHHGHLLEPASYAELIRPRLEHYALGLAVDDAIFGRTLWHNGALSPHGYSSEAVYLPEHDLSVVVLSNRPPGASSTKQFAGALLRKATGKPEKEAIGPGVSGLVFESTQFLARVLMPLYLVVALAGLVFRRTTLDRQSWWLQYHANALTLAFVVFLNGVALDSPWVWSGAFLVLAGAYRRGWWAFEPMKLRGAKMYLGLAVYVVWLLAMIYWARPAVLWAFGAVLTGEAVLLARVALRATPGRGQAAAAR
jgi:CubicO group peptidase (beta-lactamase class C family)